MSIEENRAVVHRLLEEFWNAHDVEVADDLIAANLVNHDPVT